MVLDLTGPPWMVSPAWILNPCKRKTSLVAFKVSEFSVTSSILSTAMASLDEDVKESVDVL
jgi:hypothetical protein